MPYHGRTVRGDPYAEEEVQEGNGNDAAAGN